MKMLVSNRGRPWLGVLAIGALALGLCLYGASADGGVTPDELAPVRTTEAVAVDTAAVRPSEPGAPPVEVLRTHLDAPTVSEDGSAAVVNVVPASQPRLEAGTVVTRPPGIASTPPGNWARGGNPVIFDNTGTGPGTNALASQYDAVYPFDAGIADDFIMGPSGGDQDAWIVTDVHWYGTYWNGPPDYPDPPPDTWNIIFWPNDPDDTPAGDTALPNPDYSQALAYFVLTLAEVNETLDTGASYYYSADLPTPGFLALPDTRYWIEIQAEFPTMPQWGWGANDQEQPQGAYAHSGFPLLGTPFWSPTTNDMYFSLTGLPFGGATCGNNIIEPGEECDGTEMGPCLNGCIAPGEMNECHCAPCENVCEEGKIDEGEPVCGYNYDDAYNGGCNSDPNIFQVISCGDNYCGQSGTFLHDDPDDPGTDVQYRDTDWYQVTTTDLATELVWTVRAEFTVIAQIVDGTLGCDEAVVLDGAAGVPCENVIVTAEVPPGTYWLVVAPAFFEGVDCPTDYNAELTCTTLPDPECGNNIKEAGEECDGTDAEDCWDNQCVPPGFPEECTCVPCSPVPPNDDCGDVVPTPLPQNNVGTTMCASNDCAFYDDGEVWEAFTLTGDCTDVVISYCGTDPAYDTVSIVLDQQCPCSGDFIFYDDIDWTLCGDGNATIYFNGLPAGTYYYPVFASEDPPTIGPYAIQIVGTECPQGACCFKTVPGQGCGCAEAQYEADCVAAGGRWQGADSTCTYDCDGEIRETCDCNGNGYCDWNDLLPGGGEAKEYKLDDIEEFITYGTIVRSEILVAESGVIADLDIDLLISHDWRWDMIITLTKKDGEGQGISVVIVNHPGSASEANLNIGNPGTGEKVYLDDAAVEYFDDIEDDNPVGHYRPTFPLSVFNGLDKAGLWSITIEDTWEEADDGMLHNWSLHFVNDADPPVGVDCQPNGWLDECDIACGTSLDTDPNDGIPDECQCVVECAEGSIPEGEVDCFDDYDDVFNGGCLTIGVAEDMFSPVNCGETICGTTGNYEHYVHCTPSLCPPEGGPDCECVYANYQIPCDGDEDCPPHVACDLGQGICEGGPYPEPCVDTGFGQDEGECVFSRENTRDRDWYEVTTEVWELFTFTVESEATLLAGLVEMVEGEWGSGLCNNTTDFIRPSLAGLEPCTEGTVQVELTPGTHWWYVAAAADSASPCGSRYNMTLDCEPLGCLGDTCATAEVIENLPFNITRPCSAAVGCVNDYDENCGFSGASSSPDVVYSYTAADEVVVDISLCGTSYTSKVYVYDGTCDHAFLVACADDDLDCGVPWTGELSGILFEAGHTYYIVVDGSFDTPGGKYELTVERAPGPCDRDNGNAAGASTIRAAQCFVDYTDYWTPADDFMYVDEDPGNTCRIAALTFTIGHWNVGGCGAGCTNTPVDYQEVLVTILEDNLLPPGGGKAPDGTPIGNMGECTWTTALYEWHFAQGEFDWTEALYPEWVPDKFDITVDLGQFDVHLEKNHKYWLACAIKMPFGGFYQTGWADSSRQTDHLAVQWTNTGTWVEQESDMSFFLEGFKDTCPNPCVVNEDCDDGDLCTVDTCDHEDPDADICGCVYTDVDCNDDIECTNDSCDPGTGDCINTENDAKCPEGQTCDPDDPEADPATGCVGGGDPCCNLPYPDGPYCASPYGDIVHWRACETGAPPQPDLDDIICIIDGFAAGANWPNVCPCGDIKVTSPPSCGSDDQINLDDIIAVLDSFAGNPPCAPTCP